MKLNSNAAATTGIVMAGISGEPDKPDWKAVEENLEAVEHGEAPKHG